MSCSHRCKRSTRSRFALMLLPVLVMTACGDDSSRSVEVPASTSVGDDSEDATVDTNCDCSEMFPALRAAEAQDD